jgi:glycosyltransferase involved in cell wall biosynthesis
MRIAHFSPMPPSKSGIADYSAALLDELKLLAGVDVFSNSAPLFDASQYDINVYQIGNNVHHDFVYEQALKAPGVLVLHEANLHHLIAEITIKRNDWDAYFRELAYNGGSEAMKLAPRLRALEVGPDYDGVPMLRRLLESARGIIVHSGCVERAVRAADFQGPVAVIPHGAWIPQADRMEYRHKLGLGPASPLIGIFGFLKPYKRIAESLRAFRRVLRVHPEARMILAGEPHPDLALGSILQALDLQEQVRVLGFVPIDDFVGYIAAADIVLNLRYPTVGESSGTLLRSLGLGRAVIVSGVGSFLEYPDEICLKAPVDEAEEDTLFEYLNLLVSRPDLRTALGDRARQWVERECNWRSVAERYVEFLEAVVWQRPWPVVRTAVVGASAHRVSVPTDYVRGWAGGEESARYIETHKTRLTHTLEMIPAANNGDRILEMGAYLQITPALQTKLGYSEVRGCYYGPAGRIDSKTVESISGERFACDLDLFDADSDHFPYSDGYFATVLCCELLEHLPSDPMHMMSEINRILQIGGHLVLTTPNIASLRALSGVLQGYHPGLFPAYIRPRKQSEEAEARHSREYAPREILSLLRDAGFEVTRLESGPFLEEPRPEHLWVKYLLTEYNLPEDLRGDGIYAVGVKRGPIRDRYPAWLYS